MLFFFFNLFSLQFLVAPLLKWGTYTFLAHTPNIFCSLFLLQIHFFLIKSHLLFCGYDVGYGFFIQSFLFSVVLRRSVITLDSVLLSYPQEFKTLIILYALTHNIFTWKSFGALCSLQCEELLSVINLELPT